MQRSFHRIMGRGLAVSGALTMSVLGLSMAGASPFPPARAQASRAADASMTSTDFGAACSAVPASGAGSFSGMTTAPVATAASHNPVLSTLVTAVKKAGLVDTLNNAKALTVFAPDNAAFAKIPSSSLNMVLANKAELTKLLEYHVVAGRLSPGQLAGTHKTIEGGTISVAGSGTTFNVDGTAQVVCGNVQTANATVYILGSVLSLPASTSSMTSTDFGAACSAVPASGAGSFSGMTTAPVATAASHNPVLSTLVTAVKKAGLVDTLNNAKALTVFAPDNAAFAKIPSSSLNMVLANKAELTKLLEYHVVAGRLSPGQLAGTHKTIEGGTISVAGSGTTFNVDGTAQVVCGNVQTANATVYILGSVLSLPAS